MVHPFPPLRGASSPWGPIQSIEALGPDACVVTTASHGGVGVSGTALARLPVEIRCTGFSSGGWFEEDCDWALPYFALGLDAFESDPARATRMREAAVRTVQRWHPQHAGRLGVAEAEGTANG